MIGVGALFSFDALSVAFDQGISVPSTAIITARGAGVDFVLNKRNFNALPVGISSLHLAIIATTCITRESSLFKPFIGLIAACASALVFAQASDEAAPATAETVAARPIGMLKGMVKGADRLSETCTLEDPKKLPNRAIVVVVRKVSCTSRYGLRGSKDFFEVLYAGEVRLVPSDAVFMLDKHKEIFERIGPDQIEASFEEWRKFSLFARIRDLERALAAFKETGKYGVALVNSSIFDVSKYTEGTGFEATVLNSGKKTIKYVTFTVTGLNAVGDPVSGRARAGVSPTLRGIGPIEPDATATYSKDYMWMTDIVQSYRIRSIKLEYMDGTSKVISDVKKIQIDERDYETLMFED